MVRKRTKNSSYIELAPGALVFAYLRDSGGVGQEKSVPDQRAALSAYAAGRGWTIAGWYVDEARSGSDSEHRPAFLEMIAECRIKPPPVAGILVWSLSRLGRNELEAQFYAADLRLRGVAIASATEEIPAEFAGVYEALIRWKDARFLEDLRHSVRRGQRSNVSKGFAHAGYPPVGYRADKVEIGVKRDGKPRIVSRWVVDEEKAPLVRTAFAMRAAGQTIRAIRKATNILKSDIGLAHLFRNEAYLGTLRYGDERWPDAFPALIDAETFARVQAIPPGTRYGRAGCHCYLLSSILYCGLCGRHVTGTAKSGGKRDRLWLEQRIYRYHYYICKTKVLENWQACALHEISAAGIEQAVLAEVLDRFLDPENLLTLVTELRTESGSEQRQAEREMVQREIARKRTAIGNLLDIAEADGAMAVRERLRERRAELADLEARLAAIARPVAPDLLTEETVREFCSYHRSQLASEDREAVRRVLRSLIERVTVTNDTVEITYRSDVHAQR